MSGNKMALDALKFAEAALADIGDADREPGDDLAWCEARAAEALPRTRAAIAALQAEPQPSMKETQLSIAFDALDEIALAGMSGTGMESEEAMTAWHARRAWEFIGIAARAKTAIRALPATPPKD